MRILFLYVYMPIHSIQMLRKRYEQFTLYTLHAINEKGSMHMWLRKNSIWMACFWISQLLYYTTYTAYRYMVYVWVKITHKRDGLELVLFIGL